MASILHRLSIDASPARVRELIATKPGIERWWTGRPVEGDEDVGGKLRVYFSDREEPAAVFEVIARTETEIGWRCVQGPSDWVLTRIRFVLRPRDDGGTTLLFSHEGWRQESEFMHGCSTNWAAYLMGLKAGAEGHQFMPYPAGEVSCWD